MTMETEPLIPQGWPEALDKHLAPALEATLVALSIDSSRPAHQRLANFYDTESGFAGASFAQLEPMAPLDITATDLHATRLLSVPIGPGATRRLLNDSATREAILDALAETGDVELTDASPHHFVTMERFYLLVKGALSAPSVANPNPWVTASKLCARKRPALFPVRDRVVCDLLSLRRWSDYRIDWQVFKSLLTNKEVSDRIDLVVSKVDPRAGSVRLDTQRLRILDAALWTWASGKA